MNKKIFLAVICICSLFLFVFPKQSFSQESWSLQRCIDYAIKNNIRIKQSELNLELSNDKIVQNKAGFLPNLNASANNFYNFGRTIDLFTNQFVSERTLNLNFSVSSSVTLFNGFQLVNTLKQSQLDYLADQSETDKIRNDISLNITAAFLQVLFNMEIAEMAALQVENTKVQKSRVEKLYENGAVAKGNVLDIDAQLASDELRLVNAESQLSISSLSLTQLLDLPSSEKFMIAKPEISLPEESVTNIPAEQIYEMSLKNQPGIKTVSYRSLSAEKAVKISQGLHSPKLILSGSYGTGYSDQRQRLTGYKQSTELIGYTADQMAVYTQTGIPVFEKTPFNYQMEDNINKSIGIICNIPLYNGLSARTSISRAKLAFQNAQYNEVLTKNELRKSVFQAYVDAIGGKKKYEANIKNVSALQEAYSYMEQKFNAGAVNSMDFVNIKTNLSKAKSDLLQAKYDYLFKIKILDFYQGKALSF
jgi:outer membrane protein